MKGQQGSLGLKSHSLQNHLESWQVHIQLSSKHRQLHEAEERWTQNVSFFSLMIFWGFTCCVFSGTFSRSHGLFAGNSVSVGLFLLFYNPHVQALVNTRLGVARKLGRSSSNFSAMDIPTYTWVSFEGKAPLVPRPASMTPGNHSD